MDPQSIIDQMDPKSLIDQMTQPSSSWSMNFLDIRNPMLSLIHKINRGYLIVFYYTLIILTGITFESDWVTK